MNRVNHELLKKEFGKTKNCLVIGLVCLVLSIICTGLVYYNESGSKIPKNTTYLNDVITKKNNKENVKANIKINDVSSKIATKNNESNKGLYVVTERLESKEEEKLTPENTAYLNDVIEKQNNKENVQANIKVMGISGKIVSKSGDTNKGLYVVADEDYYYLVYMSDSNYDKIKDKDLENNPEILYGTTKKVTDSTIKKSAITWYNSGVKEDKDRISTSDFEDYFGGVYLDTTVKSGNQNYYLVYMTTEKYNELRNKDLDTNPETLYGTTKKASDSNIKSSAVKWYNLSASKKITTANFESTFGGVYLDTASESGMTIILAIILMISGICTFTFLLVFFIRKMQINSAIKKLSDSELEKIEKELDDKETFHYEKAHLILTKNYIISLVGKPLFINYKDVVWIYEYRLKQYGITTNKSLMAMTIDGKIKALLQVDGVTKKSKSIIEEVVETIYAKNDKILVGYTSDNRKKANEIVKENK